LVWKEERKTRPSFFDEKGVAEREGTRGKRGGKTPFL